MQINRLRLCNFRQHENTDLALGAGLTGIIGPNGAGKTTILEAIAWAMYGMPAARGNRETIRRRGAPARARVEVELEFALGPHHYRVVRSLHTAELYQDGEPSPIANSIGAVTERITRLLSMTRDEFFNTYFTGQKELAVMARMSAPERAQFLSRVLGYERLREAQERLRERRSALRGRVETLRSGLPDLAELERAEKAARERLATAKKSETSTAKGLAAAEAALAIARPEWERQQQLRETALALESEIRVASHQMASTAERAENLERQVAEGTAAARQLEDVRLRLAPLAALKAETGVLDRQAESWSQRQATAAQRDEILVHLKSVGDRMERLPDGAALQTADERVRELRDSLAAVMTEGETLRTTWVRDAQDAQTKRQGLVERYQELKEQRQLIVAAGPDGTCPTCARPLGAEYPAMLELLDSQMEQVVANGNFYKQRIEQLQSEPKELEELENRRRQLERDLADTTSELGRLHAEVRESGRLREERERLSLRAGELQSLLDTFVESYDAERHKSLLAEIRSLEPLTLQAERLHAIDERTAALAAELERARADRDRAAAVATELSGKFTALGYTEAVFQQAREAEAAAARTRREAEIALVKVRAERAAASESVEAVARRRAERVARVREAEKAAADLALHQELDRALTDLRTDLNADLRPDLSDLASGFIRDLTNGRYTDLELDEEYNATLMEDGDPKPVISGGEEDVANLALRLAISQMIAERAGQPLSLLVLDEIFGSLDEERRSAVVELLRALADRFPQVILITHVDSVRDGFDRVVRVGVDLARGVSTITEEPLGGEDVAA